MVKVIVIRYGELFLKGKNKKFFENLLIKSIKSKLADVACKLYFGRGRYVVSDFKDGMELEIIRRLKTVFGLQSFSTAYETDAEINDIAALAIELTAAKKGSFRVNVHRADKTFPYTSIAAAAELGGRILESNTKLSVDLHTPDFVINVDIREDGKAYVYSDRVDGAGGMPVGSAGKGLLMLSGGIDSPVAGYMMAKRGLILDALHFHSYPYTSEQAKDKVLALAGRLREYVQPISVVCVPFTAIQEAIHEKCDADYMITIMRCFMMRIAERVAMSRRCGCIINGESLGQVASQTLESINVTNAAIENLPVFRPCIGMDKQDIIRVSREIGTYDISIQPYEDCCTVFLPDNPVTRPSLENVRREMSKITDAAELEEDAFTHLEIINI